jgi:cytochrome c2
MFSKIRIALGLTLFAALLIAVPAFAGGWAVITLDELPSNVVAGEPLTIGFTVLQHGKTPMTDIEPTVTAELSGSEKMVVLAEPKGDPGHYVATLTFPQEGNWDWSIQAFTMDQPMPVLKVAAPVAETVNQPVVRAEPEAASFSPVLIVRVLAFAAGLLCLVWAYQQKSRLALGLTVVAISVGLASFLMGSTVPKVEAQTQNESSSKVSLESSVSQVEMGRQLFIAKGCITCHYNDRAGSRSEYLTIDIGAPNLSNYSSAPEILFIRLKDPAAAKSDTKMPQLGLKQTEIEALVAFINSK